MTTLTVPMDAAGLEETFNDPAKVAEVTKTPKDLATFVAKYAANVARSDAGIKEQIDLGIAEGVKAFYDKHEATAPKILPTPATAGLDKGVGYNPLAPGAKLDGMVDSVAELVQGLFGAGGREVTAKAAKVRDVMNSFGSTVPSDGGFLIPEVLRSNLMSVALEQAIVRPRASVVPMDSLRVPIPVVDETTHVGSVYGGIASYWTPEAGALTESQAKFGRVVLEAWKLTAYSAVPNELVRDAVTTLMAWINQRFPQAINFQEDAAFMTGDGTGKPSGFLTATTNPALVSVAKETGQTAATVVWQNIVKMYSRMLPQSLNNAVWIVAPDVLPELFTMALQVGVAGSAIYIQNGAVGAPMTLLGRPVIVSEKASKVGTAGDISFVDLSYYLVGDRQALEVAQSEHVNFATDKTAIRFIQRVDGKPWILSAITPANGSTNTLSPFVNLATRA